MKMTEEHRVPPIGLHPTTWEYMLPKALDSTYTKFVFEDMHEYESPVCLDRNPHWKFKTLRPKPIRSAFVASCSNGRIWGRKGQSVISSDNKLLWDVSLGTHISDQTIFQRNQLPVAQYLDETIANLPLQYTKNYFHWWFDLLPLLYLYRVSHLPIDKYIIPIKRSFQLETLDQLGIARNNLIIPRNDDFHIQAKTLVIGSFKEFKNETKMGIARPKWVVDFIRREFLASATQVLHEYERIYISRANSRGRFVTNEFDVEEILKTYGFAIIKPEFMSVSKQIQLFNSAKVVIAAHGAGLANLVFCKRGTKVIELFSPNYVKPTYWAISNQVGLHYYYLIGEGALPPEHTDPKNKLDPITVNLNQLKKLMKLAGIR